MDLLGNVLEYDRWATTTLLEVSSGLTDAQLDQPIDAGHGTLRATFTHIIATIEFWSGFMAGETEPAHDESAGGSFAELSERHARASSNFASLARLLRDEGRLDATYMDHYKVRKSMGGTILTVVLTT